MSVTDYGVDRAASTLAKSISESGRSVGEGLKAVAAAINNHAAATLAASEHGTNTTEGRFERARRLL